MFGRSRSILRFAPTASAKYLRSPISEYSFIIAISLTVLWYLRHCGVGVAITIGLQIIAALAVPTVNAEPLVPDPGLRVLQREILAVYDSREETRPELTRIHRMVELPLNHLGYIVTYWDLNIGLPGPERTDRMHGVVTWLHRPQSSRYYSWAGDLAARGMRFVVLGNGELGVAAAQLEDVNRLFQEIGFEVSEGVVDLTYGSRVLHRDELIGFEQQLDPVLPAFPVISSFGPDVTSHLVLEQRDAVPRRASVSCSRAHAAVLPPMGT